MSRTNSTYQASPQNFFPFSYGKTIGESAPDDFLYVKENHLGSVLTTVSDRKLAVDNVNNTTGLPPADGLVDFYLADVVSATDYYAFGSPMPGRQFSSNSYRYGFNGKEKDDEVKGSGNSYDFGERVYDPRTGRWLSPDPAERKFPSTSSYIGMGNNPIFIIDEKGDVIVIHYTNIWGNKKTKLYNPNHRHVFVLNRFLRQTEKSLDYVYAQDSKGIVGRLARDKKVKVDIVYGENTESNSKTSVITYNSDKGNVVVNDENTGTQSAALGLFHDLGHKYNQYYDKDYKERRKRHNDDGYDNDEEKFVIENYETPLARKLGEPVRFDHGGHGTKVPNSTFHRNTNEEEFQKRVDKDYPDTPTQKQQKKKEAADFPRGKKPR